MKITKGDRWILNGKPGTVNSDPKGTGYFTFAFDGKGFADNFYTDDDLTWEPLDKSEIELSQERTRKILGDMGIKF